jgi:peptide/nickel transport system permease protein
MPRSLVRRLAGLLLTLVASSFLVYSSLYLAPGDPVATLSGGRTLPPEAVQALRRQYHLDDPFLSRYLAWLGDLVRGNPGESLAFGTGVADLIGARAATTVLLVAMASVLIVGGGVGLGLVAGIRGGLLDKSVLLATVIGQAVPSVERAFNLDGVGSLLVESMIRKDFAVVQAVSLLLVAGFILVNTLADVVYRALDPRMRPGRPP